MEKGGELVIFHQPTLEYGQGSPATMRWRGSSITPRLYSYFYLKGDASAS